MKLDQSKICVRDMELEDLDRVMAVECLSFKTPWQRSAFEAEVVQNSLAYYVVIEYDDLVVGYGGMWIVIDEGHITNIAIDPEYRGNGLGEELVLFMIDVAELKEIEALTLEVRVNNTAAIKLYEKLGFIGHGIRPKYYQDTNEDALIMWKKLSRSNSETKE